MSEETITANNFDEYFFDVHRHDPKPGQVIARFAATAEFQDSPEKRQFIDLLRTSKKGLAAAQVMRKLHHATELDSYRVPREICDDLLEGMSVDEVAEKCYRYTMEMFFYTQKEHIPENNPHWGCISLVDTRDRIKVKEIGVDEAKQVEAEAKQ